MAKTKVAIIGSGNIGTDLMIKIMRLSQRLEMGAFVGVDPESDALQRAERMGVPITAEGIEGLIAMPVFADIQIVFDATRRRHPGHSHRSRTSQDGRRSGRHDRRYCPGLGKSRIEPGIDQHKHGRGAATRFRRDPHSVRYGKISIFYQRCQQTP